MLFVVFMLLLGAGCEQRRGLPPRAIEYRWAGDDVYQPFPSVRLDVPEGRPELELLVTPPALTDTNPGVLLEGFGLSEVAADQGGAPLTRGNLPVYPLVDASAPVHLTVRVEPRAAPLFTPTFGTDAALADGIVQRNLGQFIAGILLVPLGVGLILLGLIRGYARAYAWLGLFTLSIGVLTVADCPLRVLLAHDNVWWSRVLSVSVFLYIYASARFTDRVLDGGDRGARIIGWVVLSALGVAIVADATGLYPLSSARSLALYMALVNLVYTGAIASRRALRGEATARNLLAGFAILFSAGIPDVLAALGHELLPISTAHYGMLGFLGLLIPLIERGYERKRLELAKTHAALEARVEELTRQATEIKSLNTELRHQVAERSKALSDHLRAELLRAGPLEPGKTFADRYVIVRALGEGGMGEVFEVERTHDKKRFALKVMRNVTSSRDAARFAQEAQIAADLDHPNLVSVVDAGAHGGRLYLVMELVSGRSIDAESARFGDVHWALAVLADVASGLAVLHDAGILHRDLKPANVLLVHGSNLAKISDFGIATVDDDRALYLAETQLATPPALDAASSAPSARGAGLRTADARLAETAAATDDPKARITAPGGIVGTPLYMAPELADPTCRPAPSADVFAFGVMAFELLEGTLPFDAPILLTALAGRPLPAAEALSDAAPEDVRDLVAACLMHSPSQRPSARDVERVLARYARPRATASTS
ncbi:MAG: protein kinase [Polyangiaceae bacterium]